MVPATTTGFLDCGVDVVTSAWTPRRPVNRVAGGRHVMWKQQSSSRGVVVNKNLKVLAQRLDVAKKQEIWVAAARAKHWLYRS